MDTETMIRNLKKVEEDHKDDKVFTGQLNIAEMAHDARKRLEELKPYEDTGLTPEQIVGIATELKEYKQLGLSPKRLSEHVAFCRRYHELFGAIDFSRLMELKERDTAKPPIDIEDNYGFFVCPSCGNSIYASDDFESHKFCLNCGQRIRWED